jgi:hypothetical protein
MPMPSVILDLPPDTAQRLRQRAGLAGQSLEAYLLLLAENEARAVAGPPVQTVNGSVANGPSAQGPPDLPMWEGKVVGSLTRRELYEDVD